jgi:hypothetical protein
MACGTLGTVAACVGISPSAIIILRAINRVSKPVPTVRQPPHKPHQRFEPLPYGKTRKMINALKFTALVDCGRPGQIEYLSPAMHRAARVSGRNAPPRLTLPWSQP